MKVRISVHRANGKPKTGNQRGNAMELKYREVVRPKGDLELIMTDTSASAISSTKR